MENKIWVWSDLHLGHDGIYNIRDGDGNLLRPLGREKTELLMVDNYNKVVGEHDKVFFLGDICWNPKSLKLLEEMKPGFKYLVLGNHDGRIPVKRLIPFFQKIYGVKYFDRSILTHIPVHPSSIHPERFDYNVHGHTHLHNIDDERYINVSVEQTNFSPRGMP